MTLTKLVVYLSAAFFVCYGLAFSFNPGFMAALVTDSVVDGASAKIDFRATYGGTTLATGLIILYLYSIKQHRPCLIAIICVLMCMAITRTLGFAIDGSGNAVMYVYLLLELLGSLLAFLALRVNSNSAE